ncbi:hypothetical protein DL93DRAFT_1063045 [Clavulina sp. PMI_390]|nr:hypothetical protein DL93DRAFT_1063045 [Clavulina sp. PMI_390]
MPYASPSATTVTVAHGAQDSFARPARVGGHRRSRSLHDESVPQSSSSQHSNTAAFSPLSIPRRARTSASAGSSSSPASRPKAPTFDFVGDDLDDSHSSSPSSSNSAENLPAPTPSATKPLFPLASGTATVTAASPTSNLPAAAAGLRVDTSRLSPPSAPSESNLEPSQPAIPFPSKLSPQPANSTSNIPFPESRPVHTALNTTRSGSNTPARSPSSPIIRKSNGSIVKPSLKVRFTIFDPCGPKLYYITHLKVLC